jgi:hypothetical protein
VARRNNTVQVLEDTSLDRLLARGISKLAPLIPPWLLWPAVFGAAALFHHLWARRPPAPAGADGVVGSGGVPVSLAWAAAGLTAATLVLAGLTALVSHDRRGPVGRAHNTLTVLLVGGWTTGATITGPTAAPTGSLALLGGLTLVLSWNIRQVIRAVTPEGGSHGDALSVLFDKSKDRFGLDGARARTTKAGAHKVEAALALPPGEKTVEDVQKRTEYIAGGMGLPPGSVSVTADTDRADRARLVISDPRAMRQPIPWPGPSRPGASIVEPLTPGLWQDLDTVQYVIVGHHVQLMGQSGAGKSIGGAWNVLGEIVTRADVAVLAADITKGEQTLGPLRPALHRFETTPAGARQLIRDVQAQVKPRTNHLAARKLGRWTPKCGLTYWVLWLEEFPDIGEAIDMDAFLKLLKAARSAGITIVMSLQRSDWTQMPTLARGQLAKMCFGVESAADATFGLSEAQADRGARPELWQNKQPGMAYLDAPSIPDDRIALPMRTWSWGDTDTPDAAERMAAHAAAWPAAAKTVDPTTAAITRPTATGPAAAAPAAGLTAAAGAGVGGQDDPDDETEEDGDVSADYLRTPDPNPDNHASAEDPIPDPDTDWTFEPAPDPGLTPDQARAALLDVLTAWAAAGKEHFTSRDLRPLLDRIGRSRQWAQKQYKTLIADGVIGDYDETLGGYPLHDRQPTPV